jgi:hypothetical protein
LGSGGYSLNPTTSVLTSTAGYGGAGNVAGDPAFLAGYCNGGRALANPAGPGPMSALPALDEGGNAWIDVRFGPLQAGGNYHIGAGSSGRNNGNPLLALALPALDHDVDNQSRPREIIIDRGADEFVPATVALSAVFNPAAPPGGLTATNLNFGNRNPPPAVHTATVTFAVGGAPVTFGTAAVTNVTGTAFSKGTDTCSGRTVAIGANCSITVNFAAPSGNSSRTGSLTVPYNGTNGVSRQLTGS